MTSMLLVRLPWPSPLLSPNCRAHWAKKFKAFRAYKMVARLLATQANHFLGWKRLNRTLAVELRFFPPKRFRYDEDNLIARMKAGLDGIAQAIETDDSYFHLLEPFVGDPVQGGSVTVIVRNLPPKKKKPKQCVRPSTPAKSHLRKVKRF